ncbi:winged helix-turn-helix domain-containing protein [Amycolatopsis sp., V23-08]|uniref:Winged helix-turn-helix domain-containing protein n=1 Tax=Amycolatopsis heterodermiae TaxID=3110235 RepID=A0ABU5R617_9PSEU|nr:winged helix-turn-helix domain-containing protein [Amycolatopsis sp., V23-08]MEA5360726.1 winged helix-turn-helix domain-containing protein [Amycolatopsis sp., V23-08]
MAARSCSPACTPPGRTVRLLEALRSPATTTDLAQALGVTPSAVSPHFGVLRESGLVERERSERQVRYLVTALGLAPLDP